MKYKHQAYGYIYKGYFIKHLHTTHWFRTFRGFGMSLDVVDELLGLGVTKVVHVYRQKNGLVKHLLCRLQAFKDSKKEHNNEGCDLQRFVSESDMVCIDPKTFVW